MKFPGIVNSITNGISKSYNFLNYYFQRAECPENLKKLGSLASANEPTRMEYRAIEDALAQVDCVARDLQACYSVDDVQNDINAQIRVRDNGLIQFQTRNAEGYIYEIEDGVFCLGNKINIYDNYREEGLVYGFDLRKFVDYEKLHEQEQENSDEMEM